MKFWHEHPTMVAKKNNLSIARPCCKLDHGCLERHSAAKTFYKNPRCLIAISSTKKSRLTNHRPLCSKAMIIITRPIIRISRASFALGLKASSPELIGSSKIGKIQRLVDEIQIQIIAIWILCSLQERSDIVECLT